MFYCLDVQLYIQLYKSRFVCAHIGQNRDIYPPSIIHLHFDSRHPPPLPQVDGGGCYREKFFIFSILVWILVSTLFFRLSYLIISTRLKFVILYSILFFRLFIVLTRYKFCSIFTRLRFSYSLLNFYSHQFRLVSALSILCFGSSTLYLFDSSACYKQTFMLIRVCFMLVLAILRLSDVFLFVLGVVYRLELK